MPIEYAKYSPSGISSSKNNPDFVTSSAKGSSSTVPDNLIAQKKVAGLMNQGKQTSRNKQEKMKQSANNVNSSMNSGLSAGGDNAKKEKKNNEDASSKKETDKKGTFNQRKSKKTIEKEALKAGAKGAAGGAVDKYAQRMTGRLLKLSWSNLLDSFGLTLIYINIHFFGRAVLSQKIFCEPGREWIPGDLADQKSSIHSSGFQKRLSMLPLVEKMLLILIDLILLGSILIIITEIALVVNIISNPMTLVKLAWGYVWEIMGETVTYVWKIMKETVTNVK